MKLEYITPNAARAGNHDFFDRLAIERGNRPKMSQYRRPERQAKTLTEAQIQKLLTHVRAKSNAPLSDELKVLLSFYAGLRVGEIATLRVSALCDAEGRVAHRIVIDAGNTKTGTARVIPMHPFIRDAAMRFRAEHPNVGFVAFSSRYRISSSHPTRSPAGSSNSTARSGSPAAQAIRVGAPSSPTWPAPRTSSAIRCTMCSVSPATRGWIPRSVTSTRPVTCPR